MSLDLSFYESLEGAEREEFEGALRAIGRRIRMRRFLADYEAIVRRHFFFVASTDQGAYLADFRPECSGKSVPTDGFVSEAAGLHLLDLKKWVQSYG